MSCARNNRALQAMTGLVTLRDLSLDTIRSTEELDESFFGSWKCLKLPQKSLVKAEG